MLAPIRVPPSQSVTSSAAAANAASGSDAASARVIRVRRLLLVLDVSGSMSTYSRALAMFAHAALRSGPDWEAFAFGTRLTRMTRALAAADPDAAFAAAAAEVTDWDGGTRIGASIKRLCDEWGRTRVVRGSVCVIPVSYTHLTLPTNSRV